MKKTAVIIASIILFIILLGINYLLWDNSVKKQNIETFENKEESSQQSFQNLWSEHQALKKDYQQLEDDIKDLNKMVAGKDDEIELIRRDNIDRYVIVGDKNTIITQLKRHIDTNYFKGILEEWVNNINDKSYFAAYLLHNEKDIFNNRSDIYLRNYDDKFENIVLMEVTDFKVRVIDNEESLDQDAKNRIAFDVLFNVELVKNEDGLPVEDSIFADGVNHFKVTMAFDMVSWKWYLYTID